MTSAIAGYFNFPRFCVTYNFILYPKTINENSYKYKFFDTVEKKIRDCKIYSPFSHYKENGFEFKISIGPKKQEMISFSLFDDYKKLRQHSRIIIQIYGIIQIFFIAMELIYL